MAYAVADLPQSEIDLAADDRPLLIGRNWLRQAGTFRGWDVDGVTAFTDIAAVGFESKFSGNDSSAALTKPNAAATAQYFVYDFGSEGMTVDCWALLNHNLGTIGGVTVTLAVSSDGTTWVDVATISPGTSNKRLVNLSLKDAGAVARRFTSLRYFRVKFAKGSAITPQFGEMILGRRRQLKHKPEIAWDPNNIRSRQGMFDAMSGEMTNYVYHRGRRKISAQIVAYETEHIDDFETFFETEIADGTEPFLWIDDPATSPSDANWMRYVEPELIGPITAQSDPPKRVFSVVAIEQAPLLRGGV